MCRDDRDLAIAARRLDHPREGTENVLFLECVDQSTLEFVRREISAFAVCTDLKRIDHIITRILRAHDVPERFPIFIGSTAGLRINATSGRLVGQRIGGGLAQLRIQSSLALQPIDFLAEVHDVSFHLIVGRHVLSG